MSKKKMPVILSMTVTLTAQEILALRYIHSHWAHTNGNAPFCDAMSDLFLEKIGGSLVDCDPLWDHPEAKKWYDAHEECAGCQKYFPNGKLKKLPDDPEDSQESFCDECIEDFK